jgi:hypothetical protein
MGRLNSAAQATFALPLARITISCSQVQRIAQEIGHERACQRDHKVALQRRRELPVRVDVIPAVAVEVDGGHLRTRLKDQGPGVHEVQGQENKVAALVTLKSTTTQRDPQPEPPPAFAEPRRVQRLMQQLNGWAGEPLELPENAVEEAVQAPEQSQTHDGPVRLVRTCVASMADRHAFGPMVAAEAQERGFYQATQKAFVSDDAAYNWSIWRGYFADFEPITDFLHAVCSVSGAAWGVGVSETQRWSLYQRWMGACWQGRVREVIEELKLCQVRGGSVPEGEELPTRDPRRRVAEALSYLSNNQGRMDYPRYRRAGLPCTSSRVESLVGEFNARLKSPQKFWNRPEGPEPILQLRAAVLSEDERLERFCAQRPGWPYRSRKAA